MSNISTISREYNGQQKHSSSYLNDGYRSRDDHLDSRGTIYQLSGGMFIRVRTTRCVPKAFISAKREPITGFSASSAQRMRRYLRGCRAEYTHMLTLTYPFTYPSNGKAVKEHLRRMCQELKREHARTGSKSEFSAFWFLEFQQRGAPHFHIFTNFSGCSSGSTIKFVSDLWYKIVGSEDARHRAAGTRFEKLLRGRAGTISYASKYACKSEQKAVPEGYEDVGRFWGIYGDRVVVSAATWVSERNKEDSRVLNVIKKINYWMSLGKREGKIRILVAKPDEASVIMIMDKTLMLKIEMCIARLTCLTMNHEQFFDTAEIE